MSTVLLIYLIVGCWLWLIAGIGATRYAYEAQRARGGDPSTIRFCVITGTLGIIAAWPIVLSWVVWKTVHDLKRGST